jgi:hypothetical protein
MVSDEDPVARRSFEGDVSLTVILAVADAIGRPPTEVGPLSDVLDPDALDDVFAPAPGENRREPGKVRFRFEERTVVVDGFREEVRVYDIEDG